MKYQVQIKYTNPSHEHVSLRRRVDTVTRLVEASSEQEALNRAVRQQRALGFMIKEANILTEEVVLEEGKVAKALAVGAMSLGAMGAKAHTDTTKSVAQLAAERPALAQRLQDIGATGQVPASDVRAAELQRKQDQEMPASERRAKELKKEEVEQIDEKYTGKVNGTEFSYHASENQLENDDKLHKAIARQNRHLDDDEVKAIVHSGGYSKHVVVGGKKHRVEHDDNAFNEEIEQIDEANMRFDYEAAARPKSSDVKNFLNRNKNRRAAAATKKYIRRMTKLGGLGPNQTKKDTEAHMKAYFEEVEQVDEASNKYEVTKTKSRKMPMEFDSEAKMHHYDVHHNDKRVGTLTHDTYFGETNGKLHGKDLPNIRNYGDNPHNQLHNFLKSKTGQKWAANLHKYQKEEVEQVTEAEREAGYKMPPAVRAAQKKSDALSKVKKPAQAGTLAAKKQSMKEEKANVNNSKLKLNLIKDRVARKMKTVNMMPSLTNMEK